MIEIGKDELLVMSRLIHVETLQQVVEEIDLSRPVVIDIVKQLLHYRYVKALDLSNNQRLTFNVDQILQTRFQLTAKGYEELEAQSN
jgi:hypothetical protein